MTDPVFPVAGPAAQPVAAGAAGFLGVISLEGGPPPRPGDLGHAASWPVPIRRAQVHGAWPDKVVASAASLRANRLVAPFVALARQLERAGARAITSDCSFLVLLNAQLQAAVRVPVVGSALLLLPRLLASQPRVGVLTLRAGRLSREHLRAAGVPRERLGDVALAGLPEGGMHQRLLAGQADAWDAAQAEQQAVAAARALCASAPDVRTLVLECAALLPEAQAIARATGCAVLSLRDSDALLAPWRSTAA